MTVMIARWPAGALLALLAGLGSWGTDLEAQQVAPGCMQVDTARARRGESLFSSRACVACHTIGQGQRVGPDLAGVTARRDTSWLRRFIATPGALLDSDSLAQALLAEYQGIRMPDLRLADDEVTALLHYIARASGKGSGAICSGT